MGCRIMTLPRTGKLALRLQWVLRGQSIRSQEKLGISDTPQARTVVERDFVRPIDAEIRGRAFDEERYLHWFSTGSKAAIFRQALGLTGTSTQAAPGVLTIREWYAQWIERQIPPFVRTAQRRDYRQHMTAYVLPTLGDVALEELRPDHLFQLRDALATRLKPKTIRNVIDGTFRASYRDARTEGLVTGDPFAALRWLRLAAPDPDPFTVEERDKICAWFSQRHAGRFHPFVTTLFFTGMRPSEAVALRVADIDLTRNKIKISKSRYLKYEAPTKTRGSERTVAIKPELAEIIRGAIPMDASPTDYVFRALRGGPINQSEWPKDHWKRCLSELGIRWRKFYATRHAFISHTLSAGADLLAVAKYCGTSVQVIERSYAKYMPSQERSILNFVDTGGAKTQPVKSPIAFRAKKPARMLASPTGFEPVSPT
jgi:integrase